jgi:hypothetical protein
MEMLGYFSTPVTYSSKFPFLLLLAFKTVFGDWGIGSLCHLVYAAL